MVEIISAVLSEPFYEELRTKQQLGYIVSSGVKAISDTRNLSFIVQSSVAPVEKLTKAITTFLAGAKQKYIETLTEEKVEQYIKSCVLSRTEPDKVLAQKLLEIGMKLHQDDYSLIDSKSNHLWH